MSEYVISVSDTGMPNGVVELAQTLPVTTTLKIGDTIKLRFLPNAFVFLTGLVLLASWRKSLPAGVDVTVMDDGCTPAVKNLLTNSGFREVVETGHETPSAQRRLGKLPLRPLSNRFNKEATVQEVTSILEEYSTSIADLTPFQTILSEVCENALTHSQFASPGYVSARILEQERTRKMEIAICDSGIGFRGSYGIGTNQEVIERIKKGANPIDIAIDGLQSSKPTRASGSAISYYGFGLYITRRLIEENRGMMTIISGTDALQIDHFQRRQITLRKAFPGTYVGIVLDLDNPMPLEDIYQQATEMYVGTPSKIKAGSDSKTTGVPPPSAKPAANSDVAGTSVIELRHFGTELLTREMGLAIRAEIATKLLRFEKVVVVLDGVADLTPSVADEAFGKLAEGLGHDVFSVAVELKGGSNLVNRLIDFVVKTRVQGR